MIRLALIAGLVFLILSLKGSTGMRMSINGLNMLKRFEGFRAQPYKDQAGKWTIGYGHLIKPGESFTYITTAEAEEILRFDVADAERDVISLVKVPITQNQFDALVSFTFNLGSDIDADTIAEGLGDSTLLKKLNAGDYAGAAEEFKKWNKVRTAQGLVVSQGLVARRNIESGTFLT